MTKYEFGEIISCPQNEVWGYGLVIPLETDEKTAVIVDIECLSGKIGVGCVGADGSTFISNRPSLSATSGSKRLTLSLQSAQPSSLVISNYGVAGSQAILRGYQIVDPQQLSPKEKLEAALTVDSYWHYDFDFPYDLEVKASLPGGHDSHQLNRRLLDRLIDDLTPSFKTVLDLGCSSGWHSLQLAKRGAKVRAIDNDKSQIFQAQIVKEYLGQDLELTYEVGDIVTLATDVQYDIVHCSGLLYHLQDIFGACKKIYDCAKIGAVVHSCVDGFAGLNVRLHNRQSIPGVNYNGPYEFCFVPTLEVLEKCFVEVGFSEVKAFRGIDLASRADLDKLNPVYADIMTNHTAYFLLRK